MPRTGYSPLVYDDFVRIRDSFSIPHNGWCYSVTTEEGYICDIDMVKPDLFYMYIKRYIDPSSLTLNLMEFELELTSGRYFIYSFDNNELH
jgi:hypothetical protein